MTADNRLVLWVVAAVWGAARLICAIQVHIRIVFLAIRHNFDFETLTFIPIEAATLQTDDYEN